MPISSNQIYGLIQSGPNVNVYKTGSTIFISSTTQTGGGVFNGITSTTQTGGGISIINSATTTDINFRTFSSVTPSSLLIYTASTAPGLILFSATTSTPLSISLTSSGTGNILTLSSFTNGNLVQKSISAGTNIIITESIDGTLLITSTASGGSGGALTGATNFGGGVSVYSGISGNNLFFKTISAGTNITITENSNGIILITSTASGGSGGGITGATSTGGGSTNYISASTVELTFRTFTGQSGTEVTTSGNLIIIRPLARTPNRVYVSDSSGNQINSLSLQVDNGVGSLGIGIAAATNSRLTLPAASSSLAQILLTQGSTTPSTLANGMIWYNTSGDSLKFRKNTQTTDFLFIHNNTALSGASNNRVMQVDSGGTISANQNIVNFGIFNSITSITVSNSTSELTLLPTGLTTIIGTTTINASTHITQPQLVSGKKFRFTAKGQITTRNTAAGTLTIRVYLGSSVIASTSAITLTNNVNLPNVFDIDTTFTIRSQGASGSVIGSGMLNCSSPFHMGSISTFGIYNQGVITLDTTTDKVFNITAQWSVADVNNLLEINESTLEFLN